LIARMIEQMTFVIHHKPNTMKSPPYQLPFNLFERIVFNFNEAHFNYQNGLWKRASGGEGETELRTGVVIGIRVEFKWGSGHYEVVSNRIYTVSEPLFPSENVYEIYESDILESKGFVPDPS